MQTFGDSFHYFFYAMKKGEEMSEDDKKLEISVRDKFNPNNKKERSVFVHELPENKEDFLLNIAL